MKVKAKNLDAAALAEIETAQIRKARAFYQSRPFATLIYVALQTKIPYEFLKKHEKAITG